MSQELPLKSFNPKVMLDNIAIARTMIQRIRQKDGGIGSEQDELSLHRMIHDVDMLVDMVDGLKAAYDDLKGHYDNMAATATTLKAQKDGQKESYEKLLARHVERIKELEAKLPAEEVEEDQDEREEGV